MPIALLRYIRRMSVYKIEAATITECLIRSAVGGFVVFFVSILVHYLRFHRCDVSEFVVGPLAVFLLLMHLHFYDRRLALVEMIRIKSVVEMVLEVKNELEILTVHFTGNGSSVKDLAAASNASDNILRVLHEALPEVTTYATADEYHDRMLKAKHKLNTASFILHHLQALPNEIAKQTAIARSSRLVGEASKLIA